VIDEFVADMNDWLRRRALLFCGSGSHLRFDDAVQEGRIELWRTYRETGDSQQAMARASVRMKAVAFNVGVRMTGEAPRERYTAPQEADSLDRPVGEFETLGDLIEAAGALDDVEWAYHHGEILAAFNALTPKQRQYVYARFWCGIDMPVGSRTEGVKQAKEQNPILRRDVLWTGNKTTVGAKQRLAEALEHLRELVSA
jgi:DNA-directed RNA polymerase specialized sigma24 family protein